MAVHLRLHGHDAGYACGVGARWASCTISSTRQPGKVTCRGCLRTKAAGSPGTQPGQG